MCRFKFLRENLGKMGCFSTNNSPEATPEPKAAMVARRYILIISAVAQVLLIGSLTLFWLQLLWGGWMNSSGHPSLGAAAPSWVSTDHCCRPNCMYACSGCFVFPPTE